MIKKIYVYFIRLVHVIFLLIGIIYLLKKFKNNNLSQWVLSLFYIWDIKGLIYLDCPWWTYSSIKEIDTYLKNNKDSIAFEYGSGASSVWLAKRVKKLYSVEHDKEWFNIVKKYINNFANVNYKLVQPDIMLHSHQYLSIKEKGVSFYNYVNEINFINNKFDLIVIDGRARNACLKLALKKLKKGGIIIFDNCNRKRYKNDLVKLKNKINFYPGLTPSLPYPECTAIIHNK
jgi:precorrin-6B methylase 2